VSLRWRGACLGESRGDRRALGSGGEGVKRRRRTGSGDRRPEVGRMFVEIMARGMRVGLGRVLAAPVVSLLPSTAPCSPERTGWPHCWRSSLAPLCRPRRTCHSPLSWPCWRSRSGRPSPPRRRYTAAPLKRSWRVPGPCAWFIHRSYCSCLQLQFSYTLASGRKPLVQPALLPGPPA
jgi:hypothetical protein